MSILSFLLLGIVFPAAVFASSEDGEVALDNAAVLDLVEKRVTLGRKYASLKHEIAITMYTPQRESPDTEIKLGVVNEEQLAAALYERYAAIELNVTCWLCSLYYTYGKKYVFDFLTQKKEDEEKAEKCANVAKFMSWYNRKFTAKLFVDAYGRRNTETEAKKEDELVNLIIDAKVLDILLEKVKEINDHFEQVFAQPPTYQEYLEDTFIGNTRYKEEDFLRDLYKRLWAKVGSGYVTVFNTMWIFLDYPQLVNPEGQRIPTLEQIKIQWHEIQKTDILEKKFSHVEKILSLEDTLHRTELVTRKLSVPKNFGQRNWEIEKINKDTKIEWVFKFTEP